MRDDGGRGAGMIGIVIVAHGGLAREYLSIMEHVLGRPQTGIVPVSIQPECDRHAKTREICAAADAVDEGQGVVVVVDMYGGSPSNLSMPACAARQRKILYGANLPMLIKLAQSRGKPFDAAVACALRAGRKYIDVIDGHAVQAVPAA